MSGELDKGGRHRGPASPSFGGRRTPVSTVEEAVQALAPLDTTLEEMRDRLPSSDPSFRHRMKTFMDELLLVGGVGVGWSDTCTRVPAVLFCAVSCVCVYFPVYIFVISCVIIYLVSYIALLCSASLP